MEHSRSDHARMAAFHFPEEGTITRDEYMVDVYDKPDVWTEPIHFVRPRSTLADDYTGVGGNIDIDWHLKQAV